MTRQVFDFAAQAKAPIASAGAKPRAKARIRIQKLVEKFRRTRLKEVARLASLATGLDFAGRSGRKRCAITPGEMSARRSLSPARRSASLKDSMHWCGLLVSMVCQLTCAKIADIQTLNLTNSQLTQGCRIH